MRKTAVLFLAMLMLVSLNACGHISCARSGGEPKSRSTASGTPDPTEETTPFWESVPTPQPQTAAPSEKPFSYRAANGPIVSKNADDWDSTFTLYQYDLNKKELVEAFDCQIYLFHSTLIRSIFVSAAYTKQHFTDDLSKYAVSWNDQSDGSKRVGWIGRDGNLTDVSKLVHGNDTSFSAKTINDTGAIFTPEGYLLFKDNNTGEWIWFNTKKNEELKRRSDWIEGEYAYYNPDGYWSDWKDGWGFIDASSLGFYLNGSPYVIIHNVYNSSNVETIDFYEAKYILGIQNGRLVMFGEGVSGTEHEYYDFDYYSSHLVVPVTPESDYVITGCACNGTKIAFSAKRGQQNYLFIMDDIFNPDSIRNVGELPSDYRVIFW